MPLFQNSVLNKYLKTLNKERISEAYNRYAQHFHNPTIQENIRNAREEQYQGEFLIDLFVKVLGYTKNPQPDFNLTTELKNVKDAKKADGAIIKGDSALAVIELKGTLTTDLGKVESQAFGYKNNQPGCRYVITSNFKKLRFYIDNAVEYEEFNLFELHREDFEVLWLCLSSENLLSDVPLKIKEESLTNEEQITRQLYKDYSAFRTSVFQNISETNPQYDRLLLFKKTQKLLDRFLFIFFAEDRLLLPPNSIRTVLKQWEDLKNKYDQYVPLYDRFKKYFSYLNLGHKGKEHDIFAYNGGLFAPDEILDSISINDTLLFEHTKNLSKYDFESEVSVNILGHIFEHSLTEIENIQAELEGAEIDKNKTKRKKDGVFYTPKYITKYIVENTVGKLCEEKKAELDITDEAYQPAKQRSRKRLQNLQDYRDWLLQLTICDPACGSGAFLNQALEFLISEHRYVDELSAKYNKDALILSDVENAILENNLFGVDINEESVEIAKLSLWLRTAQRGRKLTSLNDNIKCGNSLIEDPEVAGDKAFNWQMEFPEVFGKGGFDVVIGNPPYVRSRELFNEKEKTFFVKKFETSSYQLDLYKLFIELSLKLLNSTGKLSFITPSVFLTNDYDLNLRRFILDKYYLKAIAISNNNVFEDASVKTVIFAIEQMRGRTEKLVEFYALKNGDFRLEKSIPQDIFIYQGYLINELVDISALAIIKKLNQFNRLKEFFEVKNGIKVRKDLLFNEALNSSFKPFLLGKHINCYINSREKLFIHYLPQNEKLYTNQAFRTPDIFERKKLIVRQILGERILTSLDEEFYFTDQTTYVIYPKQRDDFEYLLCILNSKLLYYYFKNTFSDNKVTFPKVKRSQLLELPINNECDKNIFKILSNRMVKSLHDQRKLILNFLALLQSKFIGIDITKKLQNWYALNFAQFLKELQKNKVVLALGQEGEWLVYFTEQKEKVQELQTQIDQTDSEIDQMVYELYGLTEEEIQIVENS